MSLAIVTGSNGLVGSETSIFLLEKGFDVVGIDNNERMKFFGLDGDTRRIKNFLKTNIPIILIIIVISEIKKKLIKFLKNIKKELNFYYMQPLSLLMIGLTAILEKILKSMQQAL